MAGMTESSQPISKIDFDHSSWQNVIKQNGEHECFKYAPHFLAKAREAEAAQDSVAREVYLLLAAIVGFWTLASSLAKWRWAFCR